MIGWRKKRDLELEAGSRAHYEDAAYYHSRYRTQDDDVRYYVALAKKRGGAVLELGAGNGRIALPIARAGLSVTGVDHTRPMIDDARTRLQAESAEVRARTKFVVGDIRSVRLKKRFPLVLATFNTVLHLYRRRDVERFLATVKAHLAKGGLFVADLSTPEPKDLARSPERAYRAPSFDHPTRGPVRYEERFDYDRVRQVLFMSMHFVPKADESAAFMTPLAHRQFFPQEWEALLHYNGFRTVRVDGDFEGGPLGQESDLMVWHAVAASKGAPR